MGVVTAKVTLSNPKNAEVPPMGVDVLVDTGASTMCVPPRVADQLQLPEIEKREVVVNGKCILVPYVGLTIQFANRRCFVGALVLGSQVLLGAIPMEDMDLVIHPRTRTLSVNPASPNVPQAIVK